MPALGERFEEVHDGKRAAAGLVRAKNIKGKQNSAYRKAMKLFQDEFFIEVAQRYGFLRVGPKRKRLDRGGWTRAKEDAKLTADFVAGKGEALDKLKQQAAWATPQAMRVLYAEIGPIEYQLSIMGMPSATVIGYANKYMSKVVSNVNPEALLNKKHARHIDASSLFRNISDSAPAMLMQRYEKDERAKLDKLGNEGVQM